MTGTVSARLQDDLSEQLVNKCEELGCTKNDFITEAIEDKLNGSKSAGIDVAKVLPMLVHEAITRCPDCSEILCKELEKHGHKIVIDESKNVSHCINNCKLCWLNSPANLRDF